MVTSQEEVQRSSLVDYFPWSLVLVNASALQRHANDACESANSGESRLGGESVKVPVSLVSGVSLVSLSRRCRPSSPFVNPLELACLQY